MSDGTNFVSSKGQAEAATAALKAQEQKIKVDRLRGTLIDRKKAAEFVQTLAEGERLAFSEFLNAQAAKIAEVFAVDHAAVAEVIEHDFSEFLAKRSRVKVEISADV